MKRPLDYEQMLGLVTPSAREISASWDDVNLASGDDDYVQEIGKYFVNFHAQLLGRPELSGLVEFSGSKANERALKMAKAKTGRSKVLVSNLTHSSIKDAAEGQESFFAGIGLEPVVIYANPANGFQIDEDDLARKVSEHGKDIAAIVSTYGTTQLGHVENLATRDLVKQLREDGAWLHVDGAYGGVISRFNNYVPRNPLFCGTTDRVARKMELPDADSYTLDPYKFIGKPGASLLLTGGKNLRRVNVSYYERSPLTLDTTISFGPVVAWAQMVKDYEMVGLQELANDCVLEARLAGTELHRAGVPLVHIPELAVVPVALDSAEQVKYACENLLGRGFKVGKLHIEGNDYVINGLRFTVTPGVPEFGRIRELTPKIVKAIQGISAEAPTSRAYL